MAKVPSLAKLLENYPDGKLDGAAVAVLIGGSVRKNFEDKSFTAYKDTCAIRVSRALNYGGQPIPRAGGGLPNPYMSPKKIRTDVGGDKKFYVYSVYDLRAYLTGKYGHPKKFGAATTQEELAKKGLQGIIVFAYYHADIWKGDTCAYHNGGFGEPKVQEILVYPSSE